MDYDVANLSEQEQQDGIDNIFDSVFRTIVEYLPRLIIPLINEVFGLMYRMDEPLKVLKNEHMTWGGKLITDMLFEIRNRRFHVECQASPDGRMIIRVMEYAAAIAIGNVTEEADGSFYTEYEDIIQRLAKVCSKQEEQYLYRTLAELIIAVAVYLAPKKEKGKVKEMGGHVIKTGAQILVERGIEQGKLRNLVSLICKKIVKGKSLEAIADELEEEAETIRHIYETALKHAPKYDVDEIVKELLAADEPVAV